MFDEIHQVILDGISDNMDSLFQSDKYGVRNTADTSTNRFYDIKFISEAYTLQNNTKISREIISMGELVSRQNIFPPCQKNSW